MNRLEGRVEIMYQGVWGTICDDEWDDNDATVACKQLGLFNGYTTRQDQFRSSSGPVWLRQVNCSGNESKLSHCMHNGVGIIGDCSHAQDVAVQCSAHGNYTHKYMHTYTYYNSGEIQCWKFSCKKIHVKIFSSSWVADKNYNYLFEVLPLIIKYGGT